MFKSKKGNTVASKSANMQRGSYKQEFPLIDNREQTVRQNKLQILVHNNSRIFQLTPSATGVSLGTSYAINDGVEYGLGTPITIQGSELDKVLDSELVSISSNHTGSMTTKSPTTGINSGFMQADEVDVDEHTSSIQDHLYYYDNCGGNGSYENLQMDLFKIPSMGINSDQPMPNSGYKIKREIQQQGTDIVGIVTKTAEAVSIDSFSSSKGLTDSSQATVKLR